MRLDRVVGFRWLCRKELGGQGSRIDEGSAVAYGDKMLLLLRSGAGPYGFLSQVLGICVVVGRSSSLHPSLTLTLCHCTTLCLSSKVDDRC